MTLFSVPLKASSSRALRKRPRSPAAAAGAPGKRPRCLAQQAVAHIRLRHPRKPIGEAWPVNDLRFFDAPTEPICEINYGPLMKEVIKERGWKYSCHPCHGTYDEERDKSTFYVKEFEASLRGKTPSALFGKEGSVESDGYRLQAIPLPKHALWMLGRLPYRVPGTANDRAYDREDFVSIVVEHGGNLPGKPGNYRIAKFPGTETILFKTNLTEAFQHKTWYPQTYILPRDKKSFLQDIRGKGNTHGNMWIGKPRNDYGGSGIRVYKGTDPSLTKAVKECQSGRSIMQNYLADPLLIGGYKFHMRIHLVITNVEPLEAFVQENGQCLFATKPYTLSNKTLGDDFDAPVHVTNMGLNAIPENKDNFLKAKPIIGKGQQIRVRQLMTYLENVYPGFHKRFLWQQILQIATDTARYIGKAVQRHSKVVPDRHFELFGMDLMLDKDLKVWMCEVNTDPGIGYPDEEVLGSPNPDYNKELQACSETLHDLFCLLGLDAGLPQTKGSLKHWFELDFETVKSKAAAEAPRSPSLAPRSPPRQ